LEAATIHEDVFPAIPFGKTEIKNFFSVHEADAAGAGAEAVDEPGDSGERGHLKDLNTAEFAHGPVVGGCARATELRVVALLSRCIREVHSDTSIISTV